MIGEFYKMEYEAWDGGTETLTLEQEGAYLRFCHQMYRRRGPVLDDERVLSRIWKCHPNKARRLRLDLIESGKITPTQDGHLTNTRVTRELDARDTTRTQRAHAGKTGGTRSGEIRRNPLKHKDQGEALASTETNERREDKRREEDIDTHPPGASPAASSKSPKSGEPELLALGVEQGLLTDWKAVRRAKKAGPITPTVASALVAQAAKAGITPAEAIRISVERGWQGFQAEWIAGDRKPPPASERKMYMV